MNFTTLLKPLVLFLRHRIIFICSEQAPWVKPWWRSWKTIVRVVTCAFSTARLRPCYPFKSTRQDENMPSDLWSCLSSDVWGACPASGHARPMRFMKSLCRPMRRFPPLCFIPMDRRQKPSFVGKNARRAGRDVSSNHRNLFLYTQSAPSL